MLTAYCPRHRSNVLLSERAIRRLSNVNGTIILEVECFDGERIVVHTGRRRTQSPLD